MTVNLNILNDYIEGNLNAQDCAWVEKMLAENQDWADEYRVLKNLHEISSHLLYPEGADLETAWNNVKPSPVLIRFRPWIAAASVVLIVISFWLFYPDGSETFTAKSDTKFELPDGSIAYLQKGSEISYESDDYFIKKREVKMSGDVSFQVVSDKQNPFTVICDLARLQATGTRFRISETDQHTRVSLFTGRLSVSTPFNEIALAPGDAVSISDKKISTSKLLSDPAEKMYSLNLDDTQFSVIVNHIEKIFEVKLQFPAYLNDQKFTIRAEGMNLQEILILVKTLTGEDISVRQKDS